MTDPTAEFFDELGRRGHEDLLEKVTGRVRIDVARGQQIDPWLLAITKGDISVSREDSRADCVIRTDGALFDRMVRGEENAVAALLRGAMTFEGNLQLFILLERCLPGPPNARDPRSLARAGRASS